eukprot:TRINITY_DN8738_c0_g1_i1.p1 TRINITY_DN8738_c0_g1~~TRINITY_DN8738_c0_g1_i1.p1  ORF type:complete len:620 (+),score=176.09 TRINITY_DN8738_c0_g1_i1:76-1860(+)
MLTVHADIGSVEAVRRPFASLSNPKENELPSASLVEKLGRTSQKEEVSLVQRERLLAAKERELAELSRAQEERHQDLEVLEMRLGEREEALKHREAAFAEQKQENSCNEFEGRRAELDAAFADLRAREEAVAEDSKKLEEARRSHREAERQLAASEQRLSERAGKLATREKRVADDEGALAQLERQLRERARRLDKCHRSSADTVLEEMMCEVERRAMRFADMESAAAAFARPSSACCFGSSNASAGFSQAPPQKHEAVDFQDEEGNEISFRLNCTGGVDYYVNGNKDVCNVDCFTRGRTLHTAGMCTGRWSPARRTTVPEGEEGVLRKVMALFQQRSPEALHLTGSASSSSSGRFGLADVGPGEELTFTQPGRGGSGSRHKERGLNQTQVAEELPSEPAVSRSHPAQCSVQGGAKAVRFQDPSGNNSFTSNASSSTVTTAAAQLRSLQPPASWEVPNQQQLAPRSLAASFFDSAQRQHLLVEEAGLDAATANAAAASALVDGEGGGGQRRRRITARKRIVAGEVPSASDSDRPGWLAESAEDTSHEAAAAAATSLPKEEACGQGSLSSGTGFERFRGFTRIASAIKRRVSMSA